MGYSVQLRAPPPGRVCAVLIPENNAMISPNPRKKIPQLPESIFLAPQILKIPNPQKYKPILPKSPPEAKETYFFFCFCFYIKYNIAGA